MAVNLSVFFFSSRRRHTRSKRDCSSDVCSSDLTAVVLVQSLQDHADSQAETQDEVLQGHGAADLILRVDEPEQQCFFLVLQQSGEFLLRSEERRVGHDCSAERRGYEDVTPVSVL